MGLQALVQKYCTVMPILVWTRKANSAGGRPQYNTNPLSSPRTCRWDDKRVQVNTVEGRTVTSNAMIMSTAEIPIGSWVFQGTMAEWRALTGTYPNVPTPNQGGYEVISTGHHPDFKGVDLLYLAFV
jgi:hypothetical protein